MTPGPDMSPRDKRPDGPPPDSVPTRSSTGTSPERRAEPPPTPGGNRCEIALECAAEGVWDWDVDSASVLYSPRWKRMLGFQEDEIGDSPSERLDRIHPDDRERVGEETRRIVAGEVRRIDCRFRMATRSGVELWVRERGVSLPADPDSPVRRVVVACTDISDLVGLDEDIRATAARARESELGQVRLLAKLNEAQGIAGIGSWDWDLATGVVWWSDELYRIFEVDPGSFVPSVEANARFVHPDDTVAYHQAAEAAVRTGGRLDHDLRIITPTGTVKHCNSKARVENAPDGQPLRMTGTFMDITARKQTELLLAREKERLAITLRSIGDGVVATDEKGRIVLVNPAAERMTGWSAAEAQGRPAGQVLRIVDRITGQRPRLPESDQDTPGEDDLFPGSREAELVARDGTRIDLAWTAAAIRDGDRFGGIVVVVRDVTERRRLAESLALAEKLESLGLLAGGIAHDFNNLLGGLFGYIEMARLDLEPDAPASRLLDDALAVHSRAKDLTRQLLTFSKGGSPILRTVELGPILRQTATFALSGSNVACRFHIADALWPCAIDENQLSQSIGNIVLNAQQAMPEGGTITVSADNVVVAPGEDLDLEAGPHVRIAIADTGHGIPPEVLERIFDPFFTTKATGHGLGLATTYSIVRKHKGAIHVDSTPGAGTTFEILLPASGGEIERTAAPAPDRSHPGHGTILVMDDEEAIRKVLARMLGMMGYSTTEAPGAAEAVALCAQAAARGEHLAAAFLDLTIPGGKGGREVVADLHAIDPDLPVFASSGYSEDDVLAEPHRFGFSGGVSKPFRLEDLRRILAGKDGRGTPPS